MCGVRLLRRSKVALWAASVCASAFALCPPLTLAAPAGAPDVTFGTGGRSVASFAGAGMVLATANALHVYANGSTLLVGTCYSGDTPTMCAAKLLPDGQPDNTFGTNGLAVSNIHGYANSVHVLADGRILLGGVVPAGSEIFAMAVARLLPNGTADATFGTNGVSTLLVGLSDSNMRLTVDTSGRIVAAAVCRISLQANESLRGCVARWLSTGALDTSFGDMGKTVATARPVLGSSADGNVRVAENKIYVSQLCSNTGQSHSMCITRFDETGQLDDTFDFDGTSDVTFVSRQAAVAANLSVLSGGRPLLSGLCSEPLVTGYNPCFARLTVSGQLDPTFGTNGKFVDMATRFHSHVYAVSNPSDGSFIVAGSCESGTSTGYDICIARYTEDGARDLSLPRTLLPFADYDAAAFVATDHHGMITVAGNCNVETAAFCAYRAHGRAAGNTTCTFDVDGDGTLSAGVDGVLLSRATLGFTGNAVLQGLTFPANATRTKWGTDGTDDIRKFLVSQCGMSLSL